VNCNDRLLFHKTTSRSLYSNELKAHPACDDVVLWNTKGEVTESTIANVVVPLDGELLTPPQSSVLLPGTFRAELLAEGKIRERVITVEELRRSPEFFLINSVHKWMKAKLV
jgi:para-aminobenzoate synthetase/4-amino-4-deoxychorismate lyase